jgi:choline dehydrogenase-like flavoprotein
MVGMPAISPENYEALATKYEGQDPATHLPGSYTAEQIAGYRKQQEIYARLMRSPRTTFNEMMLFRAGGSIQNLHPASRGTVSLNPKDPQGEVTVDYRAATNDIDLDVMVEIIRFMRRYMAQDEFEQFQPRETMPGASVTSTEQLRQWSKGQIIPSVYHPVGTCAKVPREMGGCVDEALQVHGTKKLSVIDGSIMPTLIGATTCMTVYAVAEKVGYLLDASSTVARRRC